jgi:hypothetical protein
MEKFMFPSQCLRVSVVFAGLLGLSLLSAMPANAGKDVFIRTKPHVNVATSSSFVGGGTQGARPPDPWQRRPKFKCVKPKDSAALYCR